MENNPRKRKLLLIGGGGHCHSVIDSVLAMNIYDEIGIIDSNSDQYLGIPIIGVDDDIPELISEGWNEAFISVGSIGDTSIRRKLYEMIKKYDMNIATIIDPSAVIAKGVNIGEGCFVGKNAVVNSGSRIGICSVINSSAIVEHDSSVGCFVHISPGTTICGQVSVGNDSHIGAGSVVRQLISIGSGSVIGVGSVVVKDIPDNVKAYGNPCRVIEQ